MKSKNSWPINDVIGREGMGRKAWQGLGTITRKSSLKLEKQAMRLLGHGMWRSPLVPQPIQKSSSISETEPVPSDQSIFYSLLIRLVLLLWNLSHGAGCPSKIKWSKGSPLLGQRIVGRGIKREGREKGVCRGPHGCWWDGDAPNT